MVNYSVRRFNSEIQHEGINGMAERVVDEAGAGKGLPPEAVGANRGPSQSVRSRSCSSRVAAENAVHRARLLNPAPQAHTGTRGSIRIRTPG